MKVCFACWSLCFTLNLQVKDNLFGTKAVAGHAGVIPRILGFHRAYHEAAITVDTATAVDPNRRRASIAATHIHRDTQRGIRQHARLSSVAHAVYRHKSWLQHTLCVTHSSFSHFIAGGGSPTALQGSTISLIHGVVTVRLKVRTRAGAAKIP